MKVKTGADVERIVDDPRNQNKGDKICLSETRREYRFRGHGGKINYDTQQTFSEPMSAFMSGVLKVFGMLIFLGLLFGAFALVL